MAARISYGPTWEPALRGTREDYTIRFLSSGARVRPPVPDLPHYSRPHNDAVSDFEKARLEELASCPPGLRHLDAQTLQAEVSRIRASRFFRHSPRLARFLAFTVEKTLAGSAGDLKEYLIGVEVYSRRAGFDPKGDSIVRSEAVRLRHRLRQYYEVEGAQNTLRISFPKAGMCLRSNRTPLIEPPLARATPSRSFPS
jgi:hypothetical protein